MTKFDSHQGNLQRALKPIVSELLKEFRVVYVSGPRQAGKSTLVKEIAAEQGYEYITLDNQTVLASARNDPRGFLLSMGNRPVVLDEFQYEPQLIPVIKEVSDSLTNEERGRFLLTGSADIFSTARVKESLPGHMVKVILYPLSQAEITGSNAGFLSALFAEKFPMQKVTVCNRLAIASNLLAGGFPEPHNKSARFRQNWFQSYLDGRLYKDFESLYDARGNYIEKTEALMTILASRVGNLLKYSGLGKDLGFNDKVVKNYIAVLSQMYLLHLLPGYRKQRARSVTVSMPKVHLTDTGLATYLLGIRKEEQLIESQYFGGLLENFILLECLKQAAVLDDSLKFFHFRDNNQREVDIVVEQTGGAIAGIEVKAAQTVTEKDFHGLRVLADYAGKKFCRGILLYSGDRTLPFTFDKQEYFAVPMAMLLGDCQVES